VGADDPTDSIEAFFGADGPIGRRHPHYEVRDGQIRLARAVEAALADGEHLDAEAPAGTGKTYAYLVPLIRHVVGREEPGVVVTANIALQEQIVNEDLPFLRSVLRPRFDSALLKGLNNYLCLDRAQEALESPGPDGGAVDAALRRWVTQTRTGDRSELSVEPPRESWRRICGVTDLCNGSECRFFKDCFAMAARARARRAGLIITNYHLLFAHLKLRAETQEEMILPPFEAIVCDEAHEMAAAAREFFGHRLTPFSLRSLQRAVRSLGRDDLGRRLWAAGEAFFNRVEALYGNARFRLRLREPGAVEAAELTGALSELVRRLRDAREAAQDPQKLDVLGKGLRAAGSTEAAVRAFLDLDDPNQVAYVQREDDVLTLRSELIDPGAFLRRELYARARSVIAVSATLRAAGSFDYFDVQRGGQAGQRVIVESPFNFREQCLLVVPDLGCEPNDPPFVEAMSRQINRIIVELRGRTLALFTSYRNLEVCAREAQATGVTILRQGDLPRAQLLARFRRPRRPTALFATDSFWQGVDIPGDPLSCLLIDRIPFAPPSEPLMEALAERDPDAFLSFSLPRAIIDLRQGFGRLIRSRRDRGAVVIFDGRLFTKSYGHSILESLPDCEVTRQIERIFAFIPRRKKNR
jgi:ATP-dependent DNA helicase DinG